MKILYHHRTLADGAEGVHIAAMVEAFRRLGHQVRVIGVSGEAEHAGHRRTIEWVRSALPAASYELAAVAYNAPEYFRLRREIDSFAPDLLYVRHARCGVAPVLAARRRGIPVVLEVNVLFADPEYAQFEPLAAPRLVRRLERLVAELSTVVVTVSSPLASRVRAMAAANVLVVPNGADAERFDPARANGAAVRARLGLADTLTVGWVGILREWHGVELLLDAVAAIPAATLLVVGDGPARAALEGAARARGIGGRLVITGRVPHHQMCDYIAAMDIAVVANERTGVASPMKLLEYMSMRRAVVAPKAPNIEDVIVDGVNGLLFTPGEAASLAARLRLLTADSDLRARLGDRARRDVVQARNWLAIAQRVLDAVQAGAGRTTA